MQFSNVKDQQIFRDSCGGDVFIKNSETTAYKISIGRFIGDLQEFKPSDRVDTKIDASYS